MGRFSTGAVVLLAAVGFAPATADACSCLRAPEDLAANLLDAYRTATSIELVRVTSVTAAERSGTVATLEVLERFKGTRRVGSTFSDINPPASCRPTLRNGAAYLVYMQDAWFGDVCGRTRLIAEDALATDAELRWLRTGFLPPIPTVVIREHVHCQRCELGDVARGLVDPSSTQPCLTVTRSEAATSTWQGPAAFWTAGSISAGRDAAGRSFELVQWSASETRCSRRVVRRWCDRLSSTTPRAGTEPSLRCEDGTPFERVCDEEATREAWWQHPEPLSGLRCDWRTASQAECTLTQEPRHSSPQRLEAGTVVLQCSPLADVRYRHQCHVVVLEHARTF